MLSFFLLIVDISSSQTVTNISATFRNGQVFFTWDNIAAASRYALYKSTSRIVSGQQLQTSTNLGSVWGSSALNQRLGNLLGGSRYLKIDSASAPLSSTKGLFVATSTNNGAYYYAVTTISNGVEDTAIVVGANSLASPVSETVALPTPVWQERYTVGPRSYDIYTHFTSRFGTSQYPAMTNEGSFPYNFAIIKSGNISLHPVTFWMHYSGGTFLTDQNIRGIQDTSEWIVTLDDWMPNSDAFTFYVGHHENYNIFSANNPIPSTGIIYDYTTSRMAYIINWCLKNLPVDTTRTYMTGWSMGAVGSVFTSLVIPSKIAAIFVYAPLLDMGSPVPTNPAFNNFANRFWGLPATNLPTNSGLSRNDRLNSGYLASLQYRNSVPIIYTFCGRNDGNVGWTEKLRFYDSLNVQRHGGFHFWGTETHSGTYFSSQWAPNFPSFSFLTRYRTNVSYPAFSNCSINDNPGDGSPTNGDLVGTINGHLDWNDDIIDSLSKWEVTLKLKDLSNVNGPKPAPDSAVADVTPRRLQSLIVPIGATVRWQNLKGGVTIQQGSYSYTGGPITIPGVKIFKVSNRLQITIGPATSVATELLPTTFELVQNYPNPFNPSTTISYSLPHATRVTLTIYNTLGQQVAMLVNEHKNAGTYQQTWNAEGSASGVYLYRLTTDAFTETKKLVLLK